MEKLNEIKEKITNYMNDIPVEKRKSIVIIMCAVFGVVLILKCIISIAITEKPEKSLSEKISEIKEEVSEDFEKQETKKDQILTKKDSLLLILGDIDKNEVKDTIR